MAMNLEKPLASPQEEKDVFKQQVEERAQELFAEHFQHLSEQDQEKVVKKTISPHQQEIQPNLTPEYAAQSANAEAVVLRLSPDEDDTKMEELLGLVEEVGIVNTISAIEKTESFHIKDDLHRVLVQYIKAGYQVNIKETAPVYPGLHMTLFEVTLPENPDKKEEGQQQSLELLLASMEQFYAGMFSVSEAEGDKNYFSIEIAYPQNREEVVFFVAVPDLKQNIFKNQLLAIFPNAVINEMTDDYNIFNKKEQVAAARAHLSKQTALPITTYKDLKYDPLNIILQSFSNINKEEGAAIQIMLSPGEEKYNQQLVKAMDNISKGEDISKSLGLRSLTLDKARRGIGKAVFNSQEEEKVTDQERRNLVLEEIKKKNSSRFYKANIRLLAVSENETGAKRILSELKSSFHQFTAPNGNSFAFEDLTGRKKNKIIKDYTFRIFNHKDTSYLNTAELTTVFHFPTQKLEAGSILSSSLASSSGVSKQIKKQSADLSNYSYQIPGKPKEQQRVTAAPDISVPLDPIEEIKPVEEQRGVLLGTNSHQGVDTPIYLQTEDRFRHMYVIGQTGTGKTTILKNMIIQDIRNGEGCCFIDPHGSDVEDILANIPPERMDDVVYFDTTNIEHPMGLNMLEYDEQHPEQKSFVIDELLGIFKKLYGHVPESMGPAFEQYFRNATALVVEDPQSGNTMVEISRVLSDESFRNMKLARSQNMIVNQFWQKIATKAGGEAALENIVPYITNKFDVFLANDYIRPIIAQEKSAFNMRDVMDNKKILLVNLAKGKIGDLNANLIGMIMVGKILAAALSRVDSLNKNLPPFYLYMDEFQNITTDSISQILSEARKYKLSLILAHQFVKQIDEKIKDAVFGNVGSLAVFRVGQEDAEVLEGQFKPDFTAQDIANIPNYNAYLKLLVKGEPQKPFNISTMMPESGNPAISQQVKEISIKKYGGIRSEIEKKVQEKFESLM